MWEFGILRAVGLLLRTLPFVLYRMAVCFGVALLLVLGAGAGAMITRAFVATEGRGNDVLWGGLAGLLVAAGLVYILAGRFLLGVKVRHLVLLVEALDRRPVPFSTRQFDVARQVMTMRFQDDHALFSLGRLIRGVVRTATRMVDGLLEGIVPIALLDRLVRGVGLHLWLAQPLLTAVVLAQAIRTRSENAWEAAHDGLVLFTQNARSLILNALWLQVVGWALVGLATFALLAPATPLAALLPQVPEAPLLLAALFSWAVKAAVYDPFAQACMVQLHLRLTEGQEPLGEWRGRLTQVSDKFRQLGAQALSAGQAANP